MYGVKRGRGNAVWRKKGLITIKDTIVSASLLACDMTKAAEEIRRCESAGVDWIHYDVMDGHFVEQISYGTPVLKCVRKCTKMPVDVHLMVERPDRQAEFFAEAGADIIDIHVESPCDIGACLKRIRELGKSPALAVKPDTPIEAAFEYLPLCDMVLVMTVEPGYGGQGFLADMLPKVRALREYADGNGFQNLDIQVDGGINEKTGADARKAGANVLVAGTGLFNASDMKAANAALKGTL
ncbi:MAG: ribulose-phosphate 3-epimerase [Lachnospiraceae bacterium]|nr:ribulose-phosphate 3-epimerase [Ruminococcus sp.]MCM1275221.1 ribulose-phosphate 3-epimerase [Lachnospiraceae bacterium]